LYYTKGEGEQRKRIHRLRLLLRLLRFPVLSASLADLALRSGLVGFLRSGRWRLSASFHANDCRHALSSRRISLAQRLHVRFGLGEISTIVDSESGARSPGQPCAGPVAKVEPLTESNPSSRSTPSESFVHAWSPRLRPLPSLPPPCSSSASNRLFPRSHCPRLPQRFDVSWVPVQEHPLRPLSFASHASVARICAES
jgi:hypothetical protein